MAKVFFAMRIDEELKAAGELRARVESRSLSSLMSVALRHYLDGLHAPTKIKKPAKSGKKES